MQTKILELIAFTISTAGFSYGAVRLFKKGVPKYFQLFICAAGCYTLEELWVIVNSLLGNGNQDGLLTVRLFGLFGCFFFMLSANVNEFDKVVDDGKNKRAKRLALIAPAVLIALYSLYVMYQINRESIFVIVAGFISLAPALFAAYYNLKHLLLPADAMNFLQATRGVNIMALIFYAANYIYPFLNLLCSKPAMSVYDVMLGLLMSGIVIMCERGARQWKTLI